MALAVRESLADPVLREIMATREVTIRSKHSRPRAVHYRNTNNALHSQRYPVTGGKTGYTRAAGYCLLIAAELRGREVIMVFLGERDKLTRYGDFNRVARWIAAGSAPPLDTLATITGAGDLPHADVGASASGVGSL
jgi:D-alanyl-D-alanine endopeptidase (penicillin-binding protein 7)